MKIAINGFGRIGRPVFKIALDNPNLEVVAINDLADIENLAYLLKYDTAYGVYPKDVQVQEGNLIVDGKSIKIFCEKDPKNLPWRELEVDVVVDCTGVFKDREGLSGHIEAGARKVAMSAPTKDKTMKTIVMGVNDENLTDQDDIVSNASCTTNCVAPMMKVLENVFGVEKALMTTIHSYTATQAIVDSPDKKDFRRGRAGAQNIVPTTTGAAIATALTIPSLEGRFDGMAMRTPTLVGSASDVVAVLKKDTNEQQVNEAFKSFADGELRGILKYSTESLVLQDIVGDNHSVVFDSAFTKVIGGNLVKILGWYDNEWGYSMRLVDLAEKIGKM